MAGFTKKDKIHWEKVAKRLDDRRLQELIEHCETCKKEYKEDCKIFKKMIADGTHREVELKERIKGRNQLIGFVNGKARVFQAELERRNQA